MTIIPNSVKALYPSAKAAANLRSIEAGLEAYGHETGLLLPHRLAHFLPQLAHESAGFVYDREIWGDTPAQQRYDVRTDLGNTPERDGDGKKFMGRTGIQITGKGNVERFQRWCQSKGLDAPNFLASPDLLNTDPWEGIAPIWYWDEGNPTGKSLNVLADANNIEQITKRINGGLNGFQDRMAQYVRISLCLAGFSAAGLKTFQVQAKQAGLYTGEIDGDAGPQTRAALHKWLAGMTSTKVTASPVVETVIEEKPVPVAPAGAGNTLAQRVAAGVATASPAFSLWGQLDDLGKYLAVGIGILAVVVMLWRGELIAARVRKVIRSFGEADA
ncbi:glycoside hydrolase family 19 protein [Neorhizobium galegae]|uniref:glycoside hydrolase family 19 protein n=1 Tax=Neorhizobium galegae TaxID=399 RepID=UPI0006217F67|nr:glycoside hydrolase family 19 protein [Neorhizobium galegae]CDZ55090.1 Putative chitinase [Neorhizobium galegae bv. orientalis]